MARSSEDAKLHESSLYHKGVYVEIVVDSQPDLSCLISESIKETERSGPHAICNEGL